MIEIGRLCIKTAGRDAMAECVVVEIVDEKTILIDGNTRRKKVNTQHVEPLNKVLKVKKGASTKDVHKAMEDEGLKVTKNPETKKRSAPKAQTKKVKKGSDKKNKKTDSKKSAKKE